MLHQKRSGSLARLKYLVAVPIGAALLCASTLGFSKTYGWIDLAPQTLKQSVQTPPQQAKLSPPPPEAPKPKQDQVKFPAYIPIPDMPGGFKPQKTYINEKGYKIEEGGYTVRGNTYYRVDISHPSGKKLQYEDGSVGNKIVSFKNDQDKKQIKGLYEKYGYKFPDVKVSQLPAPHAHAKAPRDVVKFPPPIVAPDVPADFTPEKSYVNEKGFKVEEGPFTIGNKTYYVAIISNTTTGKKNTYYKGFNERRIKPELEDLGYKFPDVKVSPFNLLPPPPEPPKPKRDQIKFPPPVVKPDKSGLKSKTDQVKFPPPVVKPLNSSKSSNKSDKFDVEKISNVDEFTLQPSNKALLIIVNGAKYIPKEKLTDKQKIVVTSADSIVFAKRNKNDIDKWGPDAENGIMYLYGKTSVTVVPK
jgi:hypothetical protein